MDTSTPSDPRPATTFLPRSMDGWLMLVAGMALIAYGAFTIVRSLVAGSAFSLVGLVLLAVGGMLIPNRVIGMVAGALLLGAGLYMWWDNYSTLQSLVIGVLGVMAIAEHVRRGR